MYILVRIPVRELPHVRQHVTYRPTILVGKDLFGHNPTGRFIQIGEKLSSFLGVLGWQLSDDLICIGPCRSFPSRSAISSLGRALGMCAASSGDSCWIISAAWASGDVFDDFGGFAGWQNNGKELRLFVRAQLGDRACHCWWGS